MTDRLKDEVVASIPRLRGYAMSLTRSDREADRLVAAALKAAWARRDELAPGQDVQAWLLTLVRDAHVEGDVAVDAEPGPSAQLTQQAQAWRQRYGELLSALNRLPGPAREALLLVVASGVSYEEAAKAFGISVPAMRSRVQRARATLAQLVTPEPPDA